LKKGRNDGGNIFDGNDNEWRPVSGHSPFRAYLGDGENKGFERDIYMSNK
jgi:hypothetical protein